MKKSLMMSLVLLLGLTACESVNFFGTLRVFEAIQLQHKTGSFNQKKKWVTIQPGNHYASLKPESKEKYFLEMDQPGNSSKKYRFPISIPKGKDIPKYYGSFKLTAGESKLRYDINGEIDTEESQSGSYSGTDSCTYQEEVKVCEVVDVDQVCAGLTGKALRRCRRQNAGGRKCHYEYETKWGTQDTEYYTETTDRNLSIEMVLPGSSHIVATFNATDTSHRDVVTWRGECY